MAGTVLNYRETPAGQQWSLGRSETLRIIHPEMRRDLETRESVFLSSGIEPDKAWKMTLAQWRLDNRFLVG